MLAATCEKSIPLFAAADAVDAFPLPKRPNSLCVPVASVAAKNVEIYATTHEKVVDC